jgi:murein DD-endopeptidase MepM/ murein hydrolase activator NlpD
MADNREHHASKKNVLSILVVPNGETRRSRNYEVVPWHLMAGIFAAIAVVVSSVLLVLIYTPIGSLVPISNPFLENKYSKELVSLSQRMNGVMEQLVELRSYNIKLRRALGEDVSESDSLKVAVENPVPDERVENQTPDVAGNIVVPPNVQQAESEVNYHPSNPLPQEAPRIVFPAMMPVEGYTTRGYNPAQGHFGLDIAAKLGTVVCAAADGNVVFSGWTHDDGYQVILSHNGGFLTFYKHNESLLKSANAFVKRGEPIALLGNSGQTSSGPHVHFEIWKNGTPVDPKLFLLNYNL